MQHGACSGCFLRSRQSNLAIFVYRLPNTFHFECPDFLDVLTSMQIPVKCCFLRMKGYKHLVMSIDLALLYGQLGAKV